MRKKARFSDLVEKYAMWAWKRTKSSLGMEPGRTRHHMARMIDRTEKSRAELQWGLAY
jgi:hypothetical protein